ncbi:NUDIX hydrolase [Salinibacterium soli]|uniref:NUDIX domain-containing protein n=1 Tax=Antiquaquibacter soli TaxID=3064523 RepID=A0ABT9BQ96_9MICO|nr:NUDIX domain-containing protein [Protaetiibacter sp. WY-16]MDO7883203.1 NUDIX domain-containing protein [Protaetiibacter sp. WY-16]
MSIRVGAYGVMVRDGSVLLSQLDFAETGSSSWTLPGGGLEFGEHPEQAAVREIREETGYDAELGGILGIDSLVVGDRHGLAIIYEATVVGGELSPETDGSTADARWIPLDEVDALPTVELVDTAMALWRSR